MTTGTGNCRILRAHFYTSGISLSRRDFDGARWGGSVPTVFRQLFTRRTVVSVSREWRYKALAWDSEINH